MVGFVADVLASNRLAPELFIEPFAGGASVSVQLLGDGIVDAIGLVDRDPRLAAFWRVIFYDHKWMLDQIEHVPLDLEHWRSFRATTTGSVRELALACLYLNRTSFSGIIAPRAGPLGGTREFDADAFACRFPRDTLKRRVKLLAGLSERVKFVWHLDWHQAIGRVRRMQALGSLPDSIFYFVDPPFFHKADRLYRHTFSKADHRRLQRVLCAMEPTREPWLLSYDSLPDVQRLYGDTASIVTIDRFYTTSRLVAGQPMFAEAVVTNLGHLPEARRLGQEAGKEQT